MTTSVNCPQCNTLLQVEEHLKYKVRFDLSFLKLALRNAAFPWLDGAEEIYKPQVVACPKCSKEFVFKNYKFFGFIKPKYFQIGLLVFFLGFIIIGFVVIIWGAMRPIK